MIDTRLRTLEEIMTRMVRPIEAGLILKTTDDAEYINTTVQKDLLDWICGHGRWSLIKKSAEIVETKYLLKHDIPVAGIEYVVTVTLRIETLDAGWREYDGQGSESVTGVRPSGDFWANAEAQAFKRACETAGMARELWRRKLHPAQLLAQSEFPEVTGCVAKERKVEDPHPLEEMAKDADERTAIKIELRRLYREMGEVTDARAGGVIEALFDKPIENWRSAQTKVREMHSQRQTVAA